MKLKLIDKIFGTKSIGEQVVQIQNQQNCEAPAVEETDEVFSFCIRYNSAGECDITLVINADETEELANKISLAVLSLVEGVYDDTIYSLFDPESSDFSPEFSALCLQKILDKLELIHEIPAVKPREGLNA